MGSRTSMMSRQLMSTAASLVLSTSLLALAPSGHAAERGTPGIMEVDVTNDTTRRWGEPQIAVNPKNPNNIVYTIVGLAITNHCLAAREQDPASPCGSIKFPEGGSRMTGLAKNVPGFGVTSVWASFDRGKTWKRTANIPGEISVFPPSHSKAEYSAGDPMVTVGADGTFYVGWDALHWSDKPETQVEYGGIAVSKSASPLLCCLRTKCRESVSASSCRLDAVVSSRERLEPLLLQGQSLVALTRQGPVADGSTGD